MNRHCSWVAPVSEYPIPFLDKPDHRLILSHDALQEGFPRRAARLRVVSHGCQLCNEILTAMGTQCPGAQIERTVADINDPRISIKLIG